MSRINSLVRKISKKLITFSVTSTITSEKIHQLEEILLKSKDEVIDLQKRLVDVN